MTNERSLIFDNVEVIEMLNYWFIAHQHEPITSEKIVSIVPSYEGDDNWSLKFTIIDNDQK